MGPEVFVVLATVAAADGKLDQNESAMLERAAREAGVDDAGVRAMKDAAGRGVDHLDLTRVAAEERLFVYAMAYWMSRIDGEMTDDEDAALTVIGQKLALVDDKRMAAEIAVDEVAALPVGDRPARFDVSQLRALLLTRFPSTS